MALKNAATSKILAASFGVFAGYSAYRYRTSRYSPPSQQDRAASPSASSTGTYSRIQISPILDIYNEPRVALLTSSSKRHNGSQAQLPGTPCHSRHSFALSRKFLLLFLKQRNGSQRRRRKRAQSMQTLKRLMKHWANRPSSPSRSPATAASSPFQTPSTN